jgi:hypothetical protein
MLALATSAAPAQTYRDIGGTVVPGVVPLPFPFVPLSNSGQTMTPSVATALTVPGGARYAVVCPAGGAAATATYSTDGKSPHMPLAGCMSLVGAAVIAGFQVRSSSGTIEVEYFQ